MEPEAPTKEVGSTKALVALHVLLVIFSLNGVLSKLAAQHEFMSPEFLLLYGGGIALLGLYALGWQQVIKHLPLTTAYANRAVTVIWGIVWGVLFFQEELNVAKVAGALLVFSGVTLFAWADHRTPTSDASQDGGRS